MMNAEWNYQKFAVKEVAKSAPGNQKIPKLDFNDITEKHSNLDRNSPDTTLNLFSDFRKSKILLFSKQSGRGRSFFFLDPSCPERRMNLGLIHQKREFLVDNKIKIKKMYLNLEHSKISNLFIFICPLKVVKPCIHILIFIFVNSRMINRISFVVNDNTCAADG